MPKKHDRAPVAKYAPPEVLRADALEIIQHPALEGLTGLQQRFVLHYVGNPVGVLAARAAGYEGDADTLAVTASRTLRIAKVREAIDALLSEHVMSKAEALSRLSDEARGDLGDFFDVDEAGYLSLNLARAKREGLSRLLRRVRVKTVTYTRADGELVTEQTVDVETYDAQAAKDKILKSYGAYPSEGSSVNVAVQVNTAGDYWQEARAQMKPPDDDRDGAAVG